MNETIKLMTGHHSHRKFLRHFVIPTHEVEAIIASAKQAPSFENGQFYSMIRLTDSKLKQKLVELNPNNPQIKECSEAILFIADLYRTSIVSAENGSVYDVTDNHDALLTAVSDATLACENALVAAESLGYGTVIVGGIRRNGLDIIELCKLPQYTVPLFILCIGKATDSTKIKPRLPKNITLFENEYKRIDYNSMCQYDDTMKKYRDTGIDKPWISKFVHYFKKNKLQVTTTVLRKQRLIK
ncbi:hypothetical protein AOC36_02845 [Erysipelothrix larvae]|uniref:Nitroreductase domain-containing protein n=1 Tax=Erysipelothrix larvae TaxID=1514105 RepID=A0A109UGR4_9FIRM|nr:nitroreductase family protein [Erysipelothrix larvae]AMC92958.1 hypothetical protein AOC36_02845 [Erysipelothrix larvae]